MKLLTAIAAGGLAVVLAACGNTAGPAAKNTDPANVTGKIEPREISWLLSRPSDGPVIKAVQASAAEYAKQHPGFSLKLITTPDRPSYLQKLQTLAAAKQLPEFFDTDATPYAEKLRQQGNMVDVGKLLDDLHVTDTFRPAALNYQRFDDKGLYMLPLEFHMEFFFYNKALLAKAGVAVPKTLQDLVNACQPLRAAGVVPIALDGQDAWPLERYIAYPPFRLQGNDYLQKLKKGEAKLSDPTGQAGSKFVADLGAQKCFQDGWSAQGYTDALDLFTSGKAAIYNVGTWQMGSFTDPKLKPAVRDNISYFKLPTMPGATTTDNEYMVNSGIGMAINTKTFDPLVKDFVSFLIKDYPARYMALGQLSPTKAQPAGDSSVPALQRKLAAEVDAIGAKTAVPWDTKLDPTSNTRLQQELTKLAQGQETPQAFAATVDNTIAENAPKFFGK